MNYLILSLLFILPFSAKADDGFGLPTPAELAACDNAAAAPGNVFKCAAKNQSWSFKTVGASICLLSVEKVYVSEKLDSDGLFRSLHLSNYPGVAPGVSFHLVTSRTGNAVGYVTDWNRSTQTQIECHTETLK